MESQKVNSFIVGETALLRLVILLYFGSIMLISHLFSLPELIMAVMASIFMMILPVFLGHDLLTFGKKYTFNIFRNLDAISTLIIFWTIGSLFIYHLTIFSAALGLDFIIVIIMILAILVAGSLRENLSFRGIKLQHFLRPQETYKDDERISAQELSVVEKVSFVFSESKSIRLLLVFIIIVIGISATLLFRMYQPFPTFVTSEFQHFSKALQIIDDLGNLVIAEKAYFVVIYCNQAIASFLFNVHPLPILWVATFLQNVIVAGAIFATGMLIFKRTITSLITAFFSVWILGGAPVQNNPYVFSDGTLGSMFFILILYLITKNLQKGSIQFNKKNLIITFLVSLGFPALIFIQRLVVWSDSTIATLFIPLVPFIIIIFKRDELIYGGKFQFTIILLTAFTFLVMIHPHTAVLNIILASAYVILWKLVINGREHD